MFLQTYLPLPSVTFIHNLLRIRIAMFSLQGIKMSQLFRANFVNFHFKS